MSKIKIAIDISPTQNANSKRGVGFYTSRLVSALEQEIKTNPKYKNWQLDLIQNSKLKTKNYDLVHYPYFDPFVLTLPPRKNIPTIVTVHDLIPIEFAPHFPVGIKGRLKWLIQKLRLSQVDFIITDSHSSKYSIHQFTKYPLDRIYSIYLAADKIFRPISDPKKLAEIREKYHLPSKFILYVGDIDWNKNIPNLVRACRQLKYPLVISGGSAVQKDVPIHPWTADLRWLQQHQDGVRLLGFTPSQDLAVIYNLATIYCQPSYVEGFGLPLLEAMQSGCPTIYSIKSSLPEISDYHGLHFDPTKPGQLKIALQKLWRDTDLQKKYRRLGPQRAATFSWRQTALQTLAVYELALINGRQ